MTWLDRRRMNIRLKSSQQQPGTTDMPAVWYQAGKRWLWATFQTFWENASSLCIQGKEEGWRQAWHCVLVWRRSLCKCLRHYLSEGRQCGLGKGRRLPCARVRGQFLSNLCAIFLMLSLPMEELHSASHLCAIYAWHVP